MWEMALGAFIMLVGILIGVSIAVAAANAAKGGNE